MVRHPQTLDHWLQQQGAATDVVQAIFALAQAAINIADTLYLAPLAGQLGALDQTNVQGETQQQLDVISNDIMLDELRQCRGVAAMVSEEIDDVIQNKQAEAQAGLAVCFDPLDGSSNIATNGTLGSIFSILHLSRKAGQVSANDILSAAKNQLAAGYFLFGPATLLVLTTGNSVAMFALNASGQFELVRQEITIPQDTAEFAINIAYRQFWLPETKRYIEDCLAGEQGPRRKNFNMRWMGSMVADIHRIFMRGGIFLYPSLARPGAEDGKLRFLYEVNPMAMLVEAAGGSAKIGQQSAREYQPKTLHQRAPIAIGSRNEVAHFTTGSSKGHHTEQPAAATANAT